MSFTLSYEPSTLTRLLSCHSTFERISRDSATPLVTLGRWSRAPHSRCVRAVRRYRRRACCCHSSADAEQLWLSRGDASLPLV